jgi:hypothetical protein
MSVADIADNKWEREAAKAPVGNLAGMGQMLMFVGFCIMFSYIIGMSVVAIITPKKESSLGQAYKNMRQDGGTAPAAPAATPEKP